MRQRKIIHIDMDCFYAAVEMRDDPALRDKPIAVGGSADRRGVISTCNYLARTFGVHSAMASARALQLCPELVLVPGRMSVYKQVSEQIHEVFHRYTELIEPLSLDEAYLDVSDCQWCQGSATLIAEQIRQDIFETTGLTASAGIAPNKFIAKIASDENKPNGQCVVTPTQIDDFSRRMSLKKIPGVGKATFARLQALGLHVGEDVRQFSKADLMTKFGKFGPVLLERSYGIDERPVVTHRQRKSVGVEHTFAIDLDGLLSCQDAMEALYPELERRLTRIDDGLQIKKQVVKVKFADFQSTTAEQGSDCLEGSVFRALLGEAMSRSQGRSVRLLGISVGLHQPDEAISGGQMSLSL